MALGTQTAVVEQLGGRTPAGVSIGGASTDLISVYGVTPVAQASAISAVGTTGATSEIAGIETAVNSLITACKNFGIVAKS